MIKSVKIFFLTSGLFGKGASNPNLSFSNFDWDRRSPKIVKSPLNYKGTYNGGKSRNLSYEIYIID